MTRRTEFARIAKSAQVALQQVVLQDDRYRYGKVRNDVTGTIALCFSTE